MSFIELLRVEFMKVKRSMILPLLLIAPILVVVSGIANISRYFTPEYTNAWGAMYIQSALMYAYYLMPFSMIVVCVMLNGRETGNNGILKMLTLPVDHRKLSLAKYLVLLCYLLVEITIFFLTFVIAGSIATHTMGITETLPTLDILKRCAVLWITMIPSTTLMWLITIFFEKAMISVGLNFVLVIPGILVANTPLWVAYPYCYSGYVVSSTMHQFTSGMSDTGMELYPFIPCAIIISIVCLSVSTLCFGRKEMR